MSPTRSRGPHESGPGFPTSRQRLGEATGERRQDKGLQQAARFPSSETPRSTGRASWARNNHELGVGRHNAATCLPVSSPGPPLRSVTLDLEEPQDLQGQPTHSSRKVQEVDSAIAFWLYVQVDSGLGSQSSSHTP